jgi:molecular chaperone GrpE (heat shock protein)
VKATTRSKLEMGARALEFSRAHPDESPGYVAAVAELEQQLARSRELATQQRQGVVEVRAATARKRELRRTIRQRQLVHVARAARRAAREVPELTQRFALPPESMPYLTFRTLARNIAQEAQQRKELLIKYGLVEQVLTSLVESLDQFDQAVAQGAEVRRMHIAAGVELDVVGDEVVDIAQVFDGLNRYRFANDPDLFAAWRSALAT